MTRLRETIIPADSATVMINSIAQQKAAEGIRVFNLSAGEPKLPPHPLLLKAVADALSQGKILYPPVAGIPELRSLAAEWMNKAYDCRFQADQTLVINGGKLGIYLLMQLLLQKEDEVIIGAPYWVSYPAITKLFGGTAIIVNTHEANGWKLSASDVKRACTAKTKLLIINNACNPTGSLYTRAELANLLAIADEHGLLVIADEVYSELTYDNAEYISCGSFPEYQQKVIVIQSCSKNFSMTGWRVGFVFGPQTIIKALTSLISQSTSGVTTLSQWAAVAALKEVETLTTWVRENMQTRRDIVIKALNDHWGLAIKPPQSALYVFISLQDLGVKRMPSTEFCKLALEQANVALVPGQAFGKEGYVRLSFGADELELKLGLKALAKFCPVT